MEGYYNYYEHPQREIYAKGIAMTHKDKHDRNQQLVFLYSIRDAIDNDFLKMELRSRLNGTDLEVKRFVQEKDFPKLDEQKALRHLWTYMRLNGMKQDNLVNVAKHAKIAIENEMDAKALIDNLNQHLNQINLPEL